VQTYEVVETGKRTVRGGKDVKQRGVKQTDVK